MRKLIMLILLALLAGCAGTVMDIRTDVHSGATVIDSETLGDGFFTVTAKTIFSWHSDAPDAVMATVYLVGTKNISNVSFNLGAKEIKLHAEHVTVYRNSGSYSKNSFSFPWADFLALAKAAETGEVKILVTGPDNAYPGLKLDAQDYRIRLLPFIDKVDELKRQRSPMSQLSQVQVIALYSHTVQIPA